MTVCVISSVYGGHDEPHAPPAQDTPCEWVMVTDGPAWPAPWRTVTEPRPHLLPRMAAKIAKCLPWPYTGADVTIWVDGSTHVTSPGFVSWCLDALGSSSLAQHHAQHRTSILDEATEAARMPKYAGQLVAEQAFHYAQGGYPVDWGLWWTGLIVRRRDCPAFGVPWLAEMCRWTAEDQISEPPVLRALGLRPADIPIVWATEHRGCDLFTVAAHRDDK